MKELKQKYQNILFSIYYSVGKVLLNYLNIIFEKQTSEHIFFTFRAGIDYNKNYSNILNRKFKKILRKKISIKADVYIFEKRHVHIAFNKSISYHKDFDKIPEFISNEWEKRKRS